MNCLIVDDENMGRKLMEDNVSQIPFLNLVASCKNAMEALEVLKSQSIDLIFLDIQMPGMSGMQFMASLTNPPLVIFVTAYADFAVESYDVHAVDYLLKPVSLERFTLAANKAYQTFNLAEKSSNTAPLEDFFFINVEYSLVRITISQVTHIEGLKDYVKIYLEGERRPVLTKATMKSLEAKLAPHGFMRVHKSFIVNVRKIESVKQLRIKIGTHDIPVSDSHGTELIERLNATRPN